MKVNQQRKINVFYPAIERKATMPSHFLERLSFNQTQTIIDKFIALEEWCINNKDKVCDRIYIFVNKEKDERSKRRLIELKRDIYNNRFSKNRFEKYKMIIEQYNEEQINIVNKWIQYKFLQQEILNTGQVELTKEYQIKKEIFNKLCMEETFIKGLSLASYNLYEKWMKEQKKYTSLPNKIGKYRKMENALLGYLSRTAMKTSPFSTFTAVSTMGGDIDENYREMTQVKQSHVNVNQALIHRIIHYLENHHVVKPYLTIIGNPNRWMDDQSISFFYRESNEQSIYKMVKTVEKISSVPRKSPFLKLLTLIEEVQPITYGQLQEKLQAILGITEEKTIEIINRMISLGIILCEIPIPDQEYQGLEWLIRYLKPFSNSFAKEFRELLVEINNNVKQLEVVVAYERGRVLRQINELIKEVFGKLGVEGEQSWKNNLVYEDFTLTSTTKKISNDFFNQNGERMLEDLSILFKLNPILDETIYFRESINYFYEYLYKENNENKSDLLSFYYEYYLATKDYPQFSGDRIPFYYYNPFNIEKLTKLRSLSEEFIEKYNAEKEINKHEIDLKSDWVANILERLSCFSSTNNIYSVYCQPYQIRGEDQQVGLVINDVYSGTPKPAIRYSTYLKQLKKPIQEMVSTYERNGGKVAELIGTFGLNANYHPTITPIEIVYGTPKPNDEIKKISLAELYISNNHTDDVRIYTKENRQEIIPLDLGMMFSGYQPQLYKFISSIYGRSFIPFSRLNYLKSNYQNVEEITIYPRVKYGNIVLERKKWLIPKKNLPRKIESENEWEYFLKVRKWQRKIGIPENVFVRSRQIDEFYTNSDLNEESITTKKRMGALSKPQYIDFTSYFFINLFEKSIQMVENYLQVEEVFPSSEDWKYINTPHVLEWVLQISNKVEGEK